MFSDRIANRGHFEAADLLLSVPEGFPAIGSPENEGPGGSIFHAAAAQGHYPVAAAVLRRCMLIASTGEAPNSSMLVSIPTTSAALARPSRNPLGYQECKRRVQGLVGKDEKSHLLGLLTWHAGPGAAGAVRLRDTLILRAHKFN